MIITISGELGSGKSTVAKLLATKLAYKHYSTGDFMREIAAKKKLTLMELSKIAEKSGYIDKLLDKRQVDLGKKEDNFIIDGRLSFHFIPKSVKIKLKVEPVEAAKRTFNAKRGSLEPSNNSVEKTLEAMRKRKASELKRYQEYYGFDYTDDSHFDLIIDTTKIGPGQVRDKIVEFLKKNKKI